MDILLPGMINRFATRKKHTRVPFVPAAGTFCLSSFSNIRKTRFYFIRGRTSLSICYVSSYEYRRTLSMPVTDDPSIIASGLPGRLLVAYEPFQLCVRLWASVVLHKRFLLLLTLLHLHRRMWRNNKSCQYPHNTWRSDTSDMAHHLHTLCNPAIRVNASFSGLSALPEFRHVP